MAQRMQQSATGATAGSIGLADGNARVQGHSGSGLSSDNQVHQATQSGGGIGSHDGGNSHGQDSERSTGVESSMHPGNDQQGASTINDGGQNALRRNGAFGSLPSAASAFDAAKDIMEALRSKHTNLASELEVMVFVSDFLSSRFDVLLYSNFQALLFESNLDHYQKIIECKPEVELNRDKNSVDS